MSLSHNLQTSNSSTTGNRNYKWARPIPGRFKINWDVACDKNKCKLGVDAIIRDEMGAVIGTYRAI